MRSRPSTSKPLEDAPNAADVDGLRRKEGNREGRAGRDEMLHSRTRSFAEYTPDRPRSSRGREGRGAALDSRRIQNYDINGKSNTKKQMGSTGFSACDEWTDQQTDSSATLFLNQESLFLFIMKMTL